MTYERRFYIIAPDSIAKKAKEVTGLTAVEMIVSERIGRHQEEITQKKAGADAAEQLRKQRHEAEVARCQDVLARANSVLHRAMEESPSFTGYLTAMFESQTPYFGGHFEEVTRSGREMEFHHKVPPGLILRRVDEVVQAVLSDGRVIKARYGFTWILAIESRSANERCDKQKDAKRKADVDESARSETVNPLEDTSITIYLWENDTPHNAAWGSRKCGLDLGHAELLALANDRIRHGMQDQLDKLAGMDSAEFATTIIDRFGWLEQS